MTATANVKTRDILVIGRESVGKSQLISSLTGVSAGESNYRGSTVSIEYYRTPTANYIDTPGIHRKSDSEATRRAIDCLTDHELVLLVVQATHLDEDLEELLPLVCGKRGIVVVTFWDKVQPGEAAMEAIERLSRDSGVAFHAIDGRCLTEKQRQDLGNAVHSSRIFSKPKLSVRAGWRIEPRPGVLEHVVLGPLIAALLLVLPALATIFGANKLAEILHPIVSNWVEPVIAWANATFPEWLRVVLTAKHDDFGFGLLNMGPFLLVWALPTVLMFSVILAIYKASGLVERINVALHPYVRPFGLSGRDVVRVIMGFGCNVPAVISTRACSSCSRGPAISAIAFGAACSYQLPATLAVISTAAAATGRNAMLLSLVFLGYLLLTTLVYLRLTSPKEARNSLNLLMTPQRPFMQWPTVHALWREISGTIRQFFLQAMPVFVVICIVASLLARLGILDFCSQVLGPAMSLFNLPANAALPVVMASIRKDGIFLLAANEGLAFPMTMIQVLTAVYLAGVLLPCLVTALTIGRETSWRSMSWLLLRQAAFAVAFTILLAWGGAWWSAM